MVDFRLVLCGCDVEKWREMRGGGREGVDQVLVMEDKVGDLDR